MKYQILKSDLKETWQDHPDITAEMNSFMHHTGRMADAHKLLSGFKITPEIITIVFIGSFYNHQSELAKLSSDKASELDSAEFDQLMIFARAVETGMNIINQS